MCTFIVILFHHSKLLKDTPYATGDETDLDTNNPGASGGGGGGGGDCDAGDDSINSTTNHHQNDQNDQKLNDTNEPNLINNNINNDNNANQMIIMDVSDCEMDKATDDDGDDEATTTMSPTKYKDDKDIDSAQIRQTAVSMESDGFVIRVVTTRVDIQTQQHSRSSSTTSRLADV